MEEMECGLLCTCEHSFGEKESKADRRVALSGLLAMTVNYGLPYPFE